MPQNKLKSLHGIDVCLFIALFLFSKEKFKLVNKILYNTRGPKRANKKGPATLGSSSDVVGIGEGRGGGREGGRDATISGWGYTLRLVRT